jgi:bacterioferritin-associated ferredoxin
MLVCHCRAVFEREVREAVRAGAVTKTAVARTCGAGSDCGGCERFVDEIIAQETSACACSRERGAHCVEATAGAAHR